MAELVVRGLTKRFGDFTAVGDVELTVVDREFMVLLGPSGCGKSTLLRCIAGLETIDEGDILIDGTDVTSLQPRDRNISMVFQSYAVFPHLTVFENIAFGLRRQKQPQDFIDRRVQGAAELLHIEDLLDRHPASLSGGQRQRVAVARALAYDAKLLLMDEPLSNLDALLRIEMRAELKKLLHELESTVIYVTHDQVEAMSMGDRIAVMNEAEIVQVGSPIEIYNSPENQFIGSFIGNPPMNFLTGTVVDGAFVTADQRLAYPVPAGWSGPAHVGMRAENIEVSDSPIPDSLSGEVTVVEPLGSHNLLTVQTAGVDLKVTTHPDAQYEPGHQVWMTTMHDKLIWLDPESGVRIHSNGGA